MDALSDVEFEDNEGDNANNAGCFWKVEDDDYWPLDDESDDLASPNISSLNYIDPTGNDIFESIDNTSNGSPVYVATSRCGYEY